MSRNSSGNYTLPSGNPVVGGTTITTTWANATLGDLQSEMTDSLCRSGKGAMLAPLQIADGTAAAPSLTWAGDPDSGIYRAGAGDVRMQIDATQAQKWTATGTTIPGTLTVTGAQVFTGLGEFESGINTTGLDGASGNGVQATAGTPNGDAVYAQGTGTGSGVASFGGATSGTGVEATGGAPNGVGLVAVGVGTGPGVTGTGGTTGAGGQFAPGTAATATARTSAVVANSGDVVFSSVTNPNSNVALSNRLTAKNVVKAWAHLSIDNAGNVTVSDGFNITSASTSTTTLTVTFASAFSSTGFAVFVTPLSPAALLCAASAASTTTATVTALLVSGGSVPFPAHNWAGGTITQLFVMAIGAQ